MHPESTVPSPRQLQRARRSEYAVRQARHAAAIRRLSRREDNIEYLNSIKLARGCVDCGYRAHAVALDFDHLPGFEKRKGVALLCHRGAKRAVLDAELAKCEIVCANCHRVRTQRRKLEQAGR